MENKLHWSQWEYTYTINGVKDKTRLSFKGSLTKIEAEKYFKEKKYNNNKKLISLKPVY